MVPKSLRILHDMLALSGWGDVGVKPQIFDRMLTLVSPSPILLKDYPKINDWLAQIESEMRVSLVNLLCDAVAELQQLYHAASGVDAARVDREIPCAVGIPR